MNFGLTRLVKLISPNGEIISIELGGDEVELKELVSTLLDIPYSDVKGLKDKYGSYFTFSSLLKRNLNEINETYFLVLSGMYPNPMDNYSKLNYSNNSILKPPTLIPNVGKHHSRNSQNYDVHEIRSNSINSRNQMKPRSIKEKPKVNYNLQPSSTNVSNNNLFNARTMNNSHFISPSNYNYQQLIYSQHPVERNLLIAKELCENYLVEEKNIPKLQQLILGENEEVINLFRLYNQELIENRTLAISLNKILNKNNININRPNSPTMFKYNMLALIEALEYQYDEPNDINLLKQLVEYDNEFIMAAFEVYESDKDLENFVDSTKRLISRYKRGSQFNTNVNTNANNTPKKSTQNLISTHPIKDVGPAKNENKAETVAFTFEPDVEANIMSKLHTEQKCILKYALKTKHPDLDVIVKLYNSLKNEDVVIKPIKEFCKNFINEKVLKSFNTRLKEKFDSLLKSRDKTILKFFTEFASHRNVEHLEESVIGYLKKDSDTKLTLSVHSSSDEEGSSLKIKTEKDDKSEVPSAKVQKSLPSGMESKIDELIKMVSAMNFSNEEKEELLYLLKNRDPSAMNVLVEHFKTGNMISIRPVLISLVRKKKTKSKPEKSQQGGVMFLNQNEDPRKASGTILKHLKQTNTSRSVHASSNSIYNSFEVLLQDLEVNKKISPSQHSFLLKRYKLKDEMIFSVWEVYEYNHSVEELIESLKILISARKRVGTNVLTNGQTPAAVARTKGDLMDFLRTNERKAVEKIEIKNKQKNIIELLAKENMIDRDSINLIYKKIENEDDIVTSAFEIFSVTKDHWEFCETLNMITEIYNNANETKKLNSPDNKDTRLNILFDNFLKRNATFNDIQKDSLKKRLNAKDEFLMSALELFETGNDEEELKDTLRMILKKK